MKDDSALLGDFVALVKQIVAIPIDPAAIGRQTSITNDLMIDSISLVSLMTLCEEFFGVSLTEHADTIASMQTVGDALALISSLRPVAEQIAV
jgi:acyl carrier protein